jgi:hypothetical protein
MQEKELQSETVAETAAESATLPPKITKDDFAPPKRKRDKFWVWVKSVLFTILSAFLVAFSAYSLITPNNFTIGGASGLAILINIASKGKIPQSGNKHQHEQPPTVLLLRWKYIPTGKCAPKRGCG